MNNLITHIDISNMPDMARLAEEVQRTRKPRILMRASKIMAMLMPMGEPQEEPWKNYSAQRVKQALRKSTHILDGVDKAQLLTDIAQEREQAPRYQLH